MPNGAETAAKLESFLLARIPFISIRTGEQGRVHEMGPPDQLFGSPQTPELQQFLSSITD